jgi:hypothetical protein
MVELKNFAGTNLVTITDGFRVLYPAIGSSSINLSPAAVVAVGTNSATVGSASWVEVGPNSVVVGGGEHVGLLLTFFGLGASARIARACLRIFNELPSVSCDR